MSYLEFPTLSQGPDSSQYSVTYEDPAKREDMEGGYTITRARHTRRPRRTWSVGFRDLNPADKALLEKHYDDVRGGSAIFWWTNPEDRNRYAVRFKEAMQLTYVGIGPTRRWDCRVVFEQA